MRATSSHALILPFGLLLVLTGGLSTSAAGDDQATAALQVTIERAPFIIRPAASYDIPLKLQPVRQTTLVALVDGLVQPIRVKIGERVPSQTELIRLDTRLRQLELDRAKAALQAAQQQAEKGGPAALIDVAKADLALAELKLEQTAVRMPWDGMLFRVHVVEGEFVRAGDPLVTVADQTRLVVEVPIDRRAAKVGDMVEIKVEDVSVPGQLLAVLPLSDALDPLRGLFQSVASGLVQIDNADGRFLAGQTAYSAMIPRHPVGEAPVSAIANSEDGGRKVQVIRDGVIRDIPVQLLGQVGDDHVWISGRFGPQDELVLRTSEPLPDGTQVTPKNLIAAPRPVPAPEPARQRVNRSDF